MGGPEPIAHQVEAIESMDREALLVLWAGTVGGEPPAKLSQPFLRRILAWELQAREQGGLPALVNKRLESLAAAQANGKAQAPSSPKLKSGSRFLREWNGVTHVVDVVEGGYLWKGARHRSLSAIARAITGAHWSGPRFFGLQEGVAAPGAKTKRGARGAKVAILPATGARTRTATAAEQDGRQTNTVSARRIGRSA
jgi:hypothetical protein